MKSDIAFVLIVALALAAWFWFIPDIGRQKQFYEQMQTVQTANHKGDRP